MMDDDLVVFNRQPTLDHMNRKKFIKQLREKLNEKIFTSSLSQKNKSAFH